MIRRPPRSTQSRSSAASDVYKRQLHKMLKEHGNWVLLGSSDEQKPPAAGTVEAWARSSKNPIGGWYGLKKGLRGRFAMYVPPILEALGLVEMEHRPKNNRIRAL